MRTRPSLHPSSRARLLPSRNIVFEITASQERRPAATRQRAFTLIEITIALAVIAFALVAIIGILPIGLNVQRDNRAETIIHQDGTYWMEAIRGGARGLDELTNYVEFIVIERANGREIYNNGTFQTPKVPGNQKAFFTGYDIVGLLSATADGMPEYRATNVYALVRSVSGVATEKHGATTTGESPGLDFAFKYRLNIMAESVNRDGDVVVEDFNTATGASAPPEPLDTFLYDLRLRFRWPVLKINDPDPGDIEIGRRQKTFRSMATRYYSNATNLQTGTVFTFLVP